MTVLRKYTPFFVSTLLMCVVLFIIYPHYQYYIDPDGTSYLTISQRYANGDFLRAINSFWSPLGCWFTALLINTGIAAIPASVIVNALGAVGCLFITQSFLIRFNIAYRLQWMLNVIFALFLCYALFWQSFDDIWECFLLLSTLRIILAEEFINKPILWITCGVVGALAYFSKAYSLPFFMLNTACCTYFISKGNKIQWLKISLTAIGAMLLCSLPWIYTIHYKYGEWTPSTAGKLNMGWFLIGHPYWRNGIDLLLPPMYKNSTYYWEDPYVINGSMPHFWDSWHFVGREALRVGVNIYKLVVCMLQLSVFFPVIGIIAIRATWLKDRNKLVTGQIRILVISCLLLPLGFLLTTVETRYLWYLLPPGMILGVLFIESIPTRKWKNLLFIIFPLSILVFPAICMKKMYNEGANDYKTAMQLDNFHIRGSFTSMASPGLETHRMIRLAYFSGNQLYTDGRLDFTQKDVLKEMRRYRVNYFFIYGDKATESTFTDELGRPFPELIQGRIAGLKVFLVNP